MDDNELKELELRLFLEGVYERYGYDFREYAPASLSRRVWKCIGDEKLGTISGLQERVLHDPACMKRFLNTMAVEVTAMFRDPGFYAAFRKTVVSHLRTHPYMRIWHAGCASGEEVYSLAILLKEEGLYDAARIYATDMNGEVLQRAETGIYPLKAMKDHTASYLEAGGREEFANYYVARYDNAIFDRCLQKNIVWSQHNLASDGSFKEFHVIICRNVMIYFSRPLQNRVHDLFYDSLNLSGVLGLGSKESLKFTPHESDYEVLDAKQKLFRRIK